MSSDKETIHQEQILGQTDNPIEETDNQQEKLVQTSIPNKESIMGDGMDPKNKLRIFIGFCMAEFLYGASYAMMLIFFPPLAQSTVGLSDSDVGFIISATGLGGFISAFIYQQCLQRFKRRTIWTSSNLNVAILNIIFGSLFIIPGLPEHKWVFFTIAYFSKFFMGFSRIGIISLAIGTTTAMYPANPASKVTFLISWTGFGSALGPYLGQFLFNAGGFITPFYVCGALFIVSMSISLASFPEYKFEIKKNSQINKMILCNPRNFFAYLFFTIGNGIARYGQAGFSIYFSTYYNLSESGVAKYYSIQAFAIIPVAISGGYLLKRIDPRLINSVMGLLIPGISTVLVGPIIFQNVVSHTALVWISEIGMILVSFAVVVQLACTNGDALLNWKSTYGKEASKEVRDIISNHTTTIMISTWFVGPMLYSLINYVLPYQYGFAMLGSIMVILSVINLFTSQYFCSKKKTAIATVDTKDKLDVTLGAEYRKLQLSFFSESFAQNYKINFTYQKYFS